MCRVGAEMQEDFYCFCLPLHCQPSLRPMSPCSPSTSCKSLLYSCYWVLALLGWEQERFCFPGPASVLGRSLVPGSLRQPFSVSQGPSFSHCYSASMGQRKTLILPSPLAKRLEKDKNKCKGGIFLCSVDPARLRG